MYSSAGGQGDEGESDTNSTSDLCLKDSRFGVLLSPLLIWLSILLMNHLIIIGTNCEFLSDYHDNWNSIIYTAIKAQHIAKHNI
jgi:hypothetical protein